MIDINLINNNSEPYIKFVNLYNQAHETNQQSIEAIQVSSFDKKLQEVDSRFVNLKYLLGKEFIFFSDYRSPKANQFLSHDQVSVVIYWNSINVQIRMRAKIKKTSNEYNQKYFFDRSEEKNALAISSNQSKPIDSYSQVKENYNKSLKNDDLKKCPEFWGGYAFTPYYFEFWEGDNFRLNKREVFEKNQDNWSRYLLQP